MTWVTEFSTVGAEAPGIVGEDADRGRRDGRILLDRQACGSASAPASMITMAMTVAKIGRSMKKRDNYACAPTGRCRRGMARGTATSPGCDRLARPSTISRSPAARPDGHQPLVARPSGPTGQLPQLRHALRD